MEKFKVEIKLENEEGEQEVIKTLEIEAIDQSDAEETVAGCVVVDAVIKAVAVCQKSSLDGMTSEQLQKRYDAVKNNGKVVESAMQRRYNEIKKKKQESTEW